jgi:hypothetical protein
MVLRKALEAMPKAITAGAQMEQNGTQKSEPIEAAHGAPTTNANKESPPRAAEYFKECNFFARLSVCGDGGLRMELLVVPVMSLLLDVAAHCCLTFLLSHRGDEVAI